ncbi:putative secreted protein (TIGR04161 family) [Shimia isoporae]|uniref:Putative secreted protein (TIGR04161 family) n=1 Tax=Shimia isoporae TaxID=647720 RepID=A0A4R1NIG4_9RHOB|nr:VPEID-CTERM sorting domain-containing protein [Shimia isoporae]TCL08007.1 putative secreted protein (TIGR04161 family) [Shimia isoporae]
MGFKTTAKLALITASTTLMTATSALAQDSGSRSGWWWRWFERWGGGSTGGSTGGSNAVPEIDAGAGLLALAAVLATLALVWELRRRRKKAD